MPFQGTCGRCASAVRRCTTCSSTTPATGSTDAAGRVDAVDARDRAVLSSAEPDCRRARIAAAVLGADRVRPRAIVQGGGFAPGRLSRVLLPGHPRADRPL